VFFRRILCYNTPPFDKGKGNKKSVKKPMLRKLAAILLCLSVTSCNCGAPLKVTPIQRGDKRLNCKEIILEINEVEHHRDRAYRARNVSAGEALMPVCWVTDYMDADEAVSNAEDRIEYLSNIYNLLNCGGDAGYRPAPPPGQTPAPGPQSKMRPLLNPNTAPGSPTMNPHPAIRGSYQYPPSSNGNTALNQHTNTTNGVN